MAKPKIGANAGFTGAQKGLSIIGRRNHCYAYSGKIAAATGPTNALVFTTEGKGYIIGKFQLNAALDISSPTTVRQTTLELRFNGVTVSAIRAGVEADDQTTQSETQKVLIPPGTSVLAIVDSSEASALLDVTVTFVGKMYNE